MKMNKVRYIKNNSQKYIDIILSRGKSCDVINKKNKIIISDIKINKKETSTDYKDLRNNENENKESILQMQKALRDALDINDEVNIIFLFLFLLLFLYS